MHVAAATISCCAILANVAPVVGDLSDLRLHKIGFVFREFNLIPVLSAVENVESRS